MPTRIEISRIDLQSPQLTSWSSATRYEPAPIKPTHSNRQDRPTAGSRLLEPCRAARARNAKALSTQPTSCQPLSRPDRSAQQSRFIAAPAPGEISSSRDSIPRVHSMRRLRAQSGREAKTQPTVGLSSPALIMPRGKSRCATYGASGPGPPGGGRKKKKRGEKRISVECQFSRLNFSAKRKCLGQSARRRPRCGLPPSSGSRKRQTIVVCT